MEWTGFAMLILVGIGIISTGLPAAFILIIVATLGAIFGIATRTIQFSLLWALPSRFINLLENDLLQALPLYVTMGLLLGRLPVANALYRTSLAVLPKSASAPLVSGMLLGALLGPMNGSVGASVLGLSRVVSPRLTSEGVPAATRDAVIAVASTLGVLVPPSLVLMMTRVFSATSGRAQELTLELGFSEAEKKFDATLPKKIDNATTLANVSDWAYGQYRPRLCVG